MNHPPLSNYRWVMMSGVDRSDKSRKVKRAPHRGQLYIEIPTDNGFSDLRLPLLQQKIFAKKS
jgi:hypothetical protein